MLSTRKTILIAICIVLLVTMFSGCNNTAADFSFDERTKSFRTYDFANSDLEIGKDCFYSNEWGALFDFRYITRLKLNNGKFKKEKIENDFLGTEGGIQSDLFYDGDFLYYLVGKDNEYSLYCYDEDSENSEKLLSENNIDPIKGWLVSDKHMVFVREEGLFIRPLKGGNSEKICDRVLSFAVSDEKIRYVANALNEFCVYDFDLNTKKSTLLNSFSVKADSDSERICFAFSEEQVVIYTHNWDYMYVFSLESGSMKKYDLPARISQFVISSNFAFVSLVDSSDEPIGIYRFNLSDGKRELLFDETQICANLIAVNDNVAYASVDGTLFKKSTIRRISVNADGEVEDTVIYTW